MIASPWWSVPQPRPQANLRLFCLPHAGGSSIAFAAWPAAVPPSMEVQILQLPGRGDRLGEPLVDSMPALLGALVESLQDRITRPYALFGHSMGGHVAFALTQRLRALGLPLPTHLFIAGTRPAHIPPERIKHTLPNAELLDYVRGLGGTPEALLQDPEFRGLILSIMRADFKVFEAWTPPAVEPLQVPFTVMGGREDTGLTPDNLAPWRLHAAADFALEAFPGGHFFPHAALPGVVAVIRRRLAVL